MNAKAYLSGGAPSKNAILLPCVSCRNLFSAINIPALKAIVSKAYHSTLSLSHPRQSVCASSCPTETVQAPGAKTAEIAVFTGGCGWLGAMNVREGDSMTSMGKNAPFLLLPSGLTYASSCTNRSPPYDSECSIIVCKASGCKCLWISCTHAQISLIRGAHIAC